MLESFYNHCYRVIQPYCLRTGTRLSTVDERNETSTFYYTNFIASSTSVLISYGERRLLPLQRSNATTTQTHPKRPTVNGISTKVASSSSRKGDFGISLSLSWI